MRENIENACDDLKDRLMDMYENHPNYEERDRVEQTLRVIEGIVRGLNTG